MELNQDLKDRLSFFRKIFLLAGFAGIALSGFGAVIQREAFAVSYLTAFLFWLGLTIGAFPLIMIHHLTGGRWGYSIRRPLEMVIGLVPFMVLAFLPVVWQLETLYPWARPEVMAHDEILQKKELFLNPAFFYLRAAVYFVIWILLATLLRSWSRAYDRTSDERFAGRMQGLSGFGLVLFGLTVTFSAVDWGMTLEPHWFSTMYGFIFMTGQTVAALAFAVVFLAAFEKEEPFTRIISPGRTHDLGNLLLAFVMVWAYVSLSQFIIVWSGNLSEETPWYIRRFNGGWQLIALVITFFHFAVPFCLLLSRDLKRHLQSLCSVALLVLLMRWVDLIWTLKPAFSEVMSLHWLDLTCFAAIGGLWLFLLLTCLLREPVSLSHDPALSEETESNHG